MATNGKEPSGSRANNDVEVNASIMVSNNLDLNDCPILTERVSEIIFETPSQNPGSAEENRHTYWVTFKQVFGLP